MRGTSQRVALPESMDEIVAAIGPAATISLMQVFGGGVINVPSPRNLGETHQLALLLGHPLAVKLAQVVGGGKVSIPQCQRWLLDMRDAEIARRSKTEPVSKLAQDYGLTDRTVRSILARQRTEEGA